MEQLAPSFKHGGGHTFARSLGWMSIGLGIAELLGPHKLSHSLGHPSQDQLVKAYGLREIATGLGILTSRNPAPWIWGRVAGDALDLATLSPALKRDNPQRAVAMSAAAFVLGATAIDLLCAIRES